MMKVRARFEQLRLHGAVLQHFQMGWRELYETEVFRRAKQLATLQLPSSSRSSTTLFPAINGVKRLVTVRSKPKGE